MSGALPGVSMDRLRFVLGIHGDDVDKASAFFCEGVSLSSLLSAMKSFLIGEVEEEEVRTIEVEDLSCPEELEKIALAFYQGENCDWRAGLKVRVLNRRVVDGGGVRRQFLSTVMAELRSSLFEGPPGRLSPIFKQSSISSGALFTLGKIIGHSVILDSQGFPYLSPPCYFVMAGRWDMALKSLNVDDASYKVREAVLSVSVIFMTTFVFLLFLCVCVHWYMQRMLCCGVCMCFKSKRLKEVEKLKDFKYSN